jgi:two-component system response regulator
MLNNNQSGRIAADVIIVEDNEDDARITIMALERLVPKPSVAVVCDGAEALIHLIGEQAPKPKLVLLDLKLPKVHGLEILEEMKADPVAREIPVIMLTSSDEPRDIERAQELGCDAYVSKPVDWEEYIKIVCHTVARYLQAECPVTRSS